MRQRKRVGIWDVLHGFERSLIRVIILASIALVIVQLGFGLAKDPVQYYMAMAREVESHPLVTTPQAELIPQNQKQTWNLTLRATPAAPVKVLQNGKLIAMLSKGEQQITVQSGTIEFDATNVAQIVTVKIIKKDNELVEPRLNQTVVLEKNAKSLRVNP
ncbi:MAG: hypothetical protein M0T74_00800 [Desulfitobacterium hafniense]|nr:hypothetical protein [Desulfitobacterium hafniense]